MREPNYVLTTPAHERGNFRHLFLARSGKSLSPSTIVGNKGTWPKGVGTI